MKPRKSTYLLHRWIGLIVSLQLLAWSIGGFTFSILHIENVRGERDIAAPPYETLDHPTLQSLPEPLRNALRALPEGEHNFGTITLADRGAGPAWEIRDRDHALIARLHPLTARPLPNLSRDQAQHIAQRDFIGSPEALSTTLIESDPPTEYRAKPLPAYRVELDHDKRPHIYLDARTGEITARRNRTWRIFDFFWMLHTMDYQGRDDFNHWLLTAFSILAILTAASGLTLWLWRAKSRRKRKRNTAPTPS